ncbi:MAG: hypothetical protein B6243_08145 [Anaerolineaceae bacterium 4572_5.2]|nr:MAG: hypothetical protein B6243_08145 [Anaerolineaceae bacterium 4572_5.2]
MTQSLPTANFTIAETLNRWPQTIYNFQRHQMACPGCAMTRFETLAEAAKNYGLNLEAFLAELASTIQSPQGNSVDLGGGLMLELNRILVPLDGSPLGERALPMATTLAQKFGSTIILVEVLDIPTPSKPTARIEVSIDWVMEARKQTLEAARNYLDERKQEIHDQGIRVRSVLRDVSPPQDILDVAEEEQADLIVMSSHGRGGGLARWTFGSVADKILRHSPCPVLLVRPPTEELEA